MFTPPKHTRPGQHNGTHRSETPVFLSWFRPLSDHMGGSRIRRPAAAPRPGPFLHVIQTVARESESLSFPPVFYLPETPTQQDTTHRTETSFFLNLGRPPLDPMGRRPAAAPGRGHRQRGLCHGCARGHGSGSGGGGLGHIPPPFMLIRPQSHWVPKVL